MKAAVQTLAVIIAVFGITVFGVKANASDVNHDYTACKKAATESFGPDSVVKLKKVRGKTIDLKVVASGASFVVTCDRETLALVSGK